MNNIISPRRGYQLKPLSCEHQDAALFIARLFKGLENKTDLYRLSKYAGWFWKFHIRPHFFQEEKILLNYLPVHHPFREKLKNDHTEIREHMIAIDKDPDRYELISLCNLIRSHVQWEEEVFFTYIEEQLNDTELTKISEQLNLHAINCEQQWNDIFWEKQ